MARAGMGHLVAVATATFALSGCEDGTNPFTKAAGTPATAAQDGTPTRAASSVRLVDRDVEAPEVFQVTDSGLWDGRPSLGGVWVASATAKDPERVIIRNPGNGKFVIGALFRREHDNPGPPIQISSDAAAALGLLAGQPGTLNITALRREEAPAVPPDATRPALDTAETVASETPLPETAAPVAGALDTAAVAAAIDKADGTAAAGPEPALDTTAADLPAPEPKKKKWWQLGKKAKAEAEAPPPRGRTRGCGEPCGPPRHGSPAARTGSSHRGRPRPGLG